MDYIGLYWIPISSVLNYWDRPLSYRRQGQIEFQVVLPMICFNWDVKSTVLCNPSMSIESLSPDVTRSPIYLSQRYNPFPSLSYLYRSLKEEWTTDSKRPQIRWQKEWSFLGENETMYWEPFSLSKSILSIILIVLPSVDSESESISIIVQLSIKTDRNKLQVMNCIVLVGYLINQFTIISFNFGIDALWFAF